MRQMLPVEILLLNGLDTGPIQYTVPNWTGVVYKIPRNVLGSCSNREDLKQTGVYFLFGNSEEAMKPTVYVGQAGIRQNGNSFLQRILEPHNGISDWNEVVAITTVDDSFGPTDICYLENRFFNMATDANRYIVTNDNTPNPGNLTEWKQCSLEKFIDFSKIVMGILGHKVFVPLDEITEDTPRENVVQLHLKERWAEANGVLTSEGIVVRKGSKIRANPVPSCPDWIIKLRDQHKEHIDTERSVLLEDIAFSSPSQAAAFCVFGTANGRVAWKDESGKTLKERDAESLTAHTRENEPNAE